jgi:Asp-tRNA(Asn)/Glu-tRNA(Gln) amidotransferase A subunit family amidase
MARTAEDAAIVFNVMHGADEKDPGSITMPFHFNPNIDLSKLRIGVRAQNAQNPDATFTAFVEKLKALGAKPKDIAEPPTVAGSAGGIDVESAAAFDSYVQMKAKQLGMDMATVLTTYGRQANGGRGAGGGGGANATPAAVAAAAAAANTANLNGQLNRWVPGRTPTAFDFINSQRRRHKLITAWQEYLKDIDLYVGAADTGVHAQTGHPVVVVQMGFGVRAPQGGGRGGAAPATPAAPLNPQPICTQIAGNLYNDDIILSVAHKYQSNTDWLRERPKLG